MTNKAEIINIYNNIIGNLLNIKENLHYVPLNLWLYGISMSSITNVEEARNNWIKK